jgi:hypothetical protein
MAMKPILKAFLLIGFAIVDTAYAASSTDPLDTWTPVNPGWSNGILSIAYGRGTYVAAGGSVILTSTNGDNWGIQQRYASWISYVNGQFLGDGYQLGSGSKFFQSPNGTNWFTYALQGFSCVTYGNGLFVAGGGDRTVFSSQYAITWTQHNFGATSALEGLAYGNGMFVGVVFDGQIIHSSDGTNWSLVTPKPNNTWLDVIYGNGLFVAVDGFGAFANSFDGENWNLGRTPAHYLQKVAYGSGMYVAVGREGNLVTSPDGNTWTARNSGTIEELDGVCYGDGFFLVGGLNGVMLKSLPYATYRGPVITLEPMSQIAITGEKVTMAANVSGDLPFAFQWEKDGQKIPGQTNTTLLFDSVHPADSGSYTLAISNAVGATNTAPAVLTVKDIGIALNGQLMTDSTFSAGGSAIVGITSLYPNGSVFYTLDGSEPDFNSTAYGGPFWVSTSGVLRVIAYSPDLSQSVASDPVAIVILPTYNLFATSSGGGAITVDPPTAQFASNAVATLSASPWPGWKFMGWSGAMSGTNATNTVVMDGDRHVEAVFGTALNTTVAGKGTVSVYPSAALYPYGSKVRVSAVPDQGSYFGVWGNAGSGNQNPLSFFVTSTNPSISALFAALPANQAALTVLLDGGGVVSANPLANKYPLGSATVLTAVPGTGQQFLGWSGDINGVANPLSLTMDTSKVVTAHFSRAPSLGITALYGGQFQVSLTGVPGNAYRIEGSQDLSAWTALTTLTNYFDTAVFFDPESERLRYRMYRAVLAQ